MFYIRPRVFRLFRIIVLFQEEEFNRFLDDHSKATGAWSAKCTQFHVEALVMQWNDILYYIMSFDWCKQCLALLTVLFVVWLFRFRLLLRASYGHKITRWCQNVRIHQKNRMLLPGKNFRWTFSFKLQLILKVYLIFNQIKTASLPSEN